MSLKSNVTEAKQKAKIEKLNQKVVILEKMIEEHSYELYVSNQKLKDNVNKLRDTQRQIVQSAKLASLGEMCTSIAHELNNPLFLIKGFNEHLMSVLEDENSINIDELKNYSNEIDENCERMRKIISHMRTFSRRADLDFSEIDLNDVIHSSFTLIHEQLIKRNIKIQKNLSKKTLKIKGDAIQLEQVLLNLYTNSRDAMASNTTVPGCLTVSSLEKDSRAVITVSDNGSGISEKDRDKIFNPFYTTKPVGSGTGLGLSISHTIIAHHGGEISFFSSPETGGTTFTLVFPLA